MRVPPPSPAGRRRGRRQAGLAERADPGRTGRPDPTPAIATGHAARLRRAGRRHRPLPEPQTPPARRHARPGRGRIGRPPGARTPGPAAEAAGPGVAELRAGAGPGGRGGRVFLARRAARVRPGRPRPVSPRACLPGRGRPRLRHRPHWAPGGLWSPGRPTRWRSLFTELFPGRFSARVRVRENRRARSLNRAKAVMARAEVGRRARQLQPGHAGQLPSGNGKVMGTIGVLNLMSVAAARSRARRRASVTSSTS